MCSFDRESHGLFLLVTVVDCLEVLHGAHLVMSLNGSLRLCTLGVTSCFVFARLPLDEMRCFLADDGARLHVEVHDGMVAQAAFVAAAARA
jgi:hypothetical protein